MIPVETIEACRDILLDEVNEAYTVFHLKRADWALVSKDAAIKFPSARDIREENWGQWSREAEDQLRHASRAQITAYFCQRFHLKDEGEICDEIGC